MTTTEPDNPFAPFWPGGAEELKLRTYVAGRIRSARRDARITQAALGEVVFGPICSNARSRINRLERTPEKHSVTLPQLYLIAAFLRQPLTYFLPRPTVSSQQVRSRTLLWLDEAHREIVRDQMDCTMQEALQHARTTLPAEAAGLVVACDPEQPGVLALGRDHEESGDE